MRGNKNNKTQQPFSAVHEAERVEEVIKGEVDLDGETFINCPGHWVRHKSRNGEKDCSETRSINHDQRDFFFGVTISNRKCVTRTTRSESLIIFGVSCVPCDVWREIKCACSPSAGCFFHPCPSIVASFIIWLSLQNVLCLLTTVTKLFSQCVPPWSVSHGSKV